jgi:hypothetical protein
MTHRLEGYKLRLRTVTVGREEAKRDRIDQVRLRLELGKNRLDKIESLRFRCVTPIPRGLKWNRWQRGIFGACTVTVLTLVVFKFMACVSPFFTGSSVIYCLLCQALIKNINVMYITDREH